MRFSRESVLSKCNEGTKTAALSKDHVLNVYTSLFKRKNWNPKLVELAIANLNPTYDGERQALLHVSSQILTKNGTYYYIGISL